MALLPSGEYKLIEKDGVRDKKKSLLFVKLTDSAHRALSDFLQNQDKLAVKPMIEFDKDNGLLQIPTSSKGSTGTDRCMAQFKFNVISNVTMQGRQGRFTCIKHKHKSKKLKDLGIMTKRLRIHANEDVFEITKNRMAEVDLEQRKICTREIDLYSDTVNRRIKIDRNTKMSASKPVSAVIENKAISRLLSLKSAQSRSKAAPSNVPKSLNPIAKRPLRERIIHLLAVRPLKKIELSAALRRDGLRETDKARFMSTLVSVSTLKDNVYHLLRHVWNDVQEDWPYYNEQEKQQMKRNKPQNLTPPSSDSGISTTSNQSPTTTPGDRSPSSQYKRPGYHSGVDGFQTKRPRISHFSRPSWKPNTNKSVGCDENVHQISPSRTTNCFDHIIEKSGLSNTSVTNRPLMRNFKQNTNNPKGSVETVEVQCNEITKSNIVTSPAYLKKYVTINDIDQRRQYKADFQKSYIEYKNLEKQVYPVSEAFKKLAERLKQHEKGSPDRKSVV